MITLEIASNTDLVQAVNAAITESGYKKSYIADQLGITRQAFSQLLAKNNFNINDANRILEIIGYRMNLELSKKLN